MESRRLREQRALYARAGFNDLRVNRPTSFLPVPWDGDGDYGPGDWHVGTDSGYWVGGDGLVHGPVGPNGPGFGPASRTSGSPLTEQDYRPNVGGYEAVMPAVTRCVSIITESVVRTRWLYNGPSGAQPRPLWVDDPMLLGRAPGPLFPLTAYGHRHTGHTFFTTLLSDAILFGQAGFVFIESSDGTPLAGSLRLLNPFMFGNDETGHVVLDKWGENPLRTDFDGRFTVGGQTWRVAVLHGQFPIHDGWPTGVLLRHWPTFRLGVRIGRYLDGFYTAGIPSGYLSVSTPNYGVEVEDPDAPGQMVNEAELLKRTWMKAHGRGKRSVAVLNSTVTYTPISVNPVDGEAEKMVRVNRADIAHAFGLSSVYLDEAMGGLTYSNASERRADMVAMTAAGWGEKLTNLIQSLLPYGHRVSVNWPEFISPSTETLMPSLVQAVQSGIITGSEARQFLGMIPWVGPDPKYVDTTKAAMGAFSPEQEA